MAPPEVDLEDREHLHASDIGTSANINISIKDDTSGLRDGEPTVLPLEVPSSLAIQAPEKSFIESLNVFFLIWKIRFLLQMKKLSFLTSFSLKGKIVYAKKKCV